MSSEPPLTLIGSAGSTPSCHSREPQAGQKAQISVRPLSARRDQRATAPRPRRKSARRTISEMPKAEADCFRHSRQWQT